MEIPDGEGSVTDWVRQLNQSKDEASQRLWERYTSRLVGLARRKLGGYPRKVLDEEDVAIMAFEQFCRNAKEGRFPRLHDRNDVWQILVMITERRAIDVKRRQIGPTGESSGAKLADAAAREPTAEFAAAMSDQLLLLLESLGDAQLRSIVQYKIAAYSNDEIAKLLNCSTRTVERKLNMIRKRWISIAEDAGGFTEM